MKKLSIIIIYLLYISKLFSQEIITKANYLKTDGEMIINSKYVNNGWQDFNAGNEYQEINNRMELINKWWE